MSVEAVAKSYFQAWEARDLDAIMALHSPDTVFHSHTGQQPVTGAAQVRVAFGQLLQMTPDISFKAWDLRFGDDFWVAQMIVSGTRRQTDGSDIAFSSNSTDVILVKDGLVTRKDSYVDYVKLLSQFGRPAA
jgi:steroid delta-isomerase-like uncharacterized protein